MSTLNLNQLYNTVFSIQTFLYLNINDLILFVSFIFFLAYFGFIFNSRNFLLTMLCMELVYLATITTLLSISNNLLDLTGYTFALFLVAIAAIESAVGLCLLTILFK